MFEELFTTRKPSESKLNPSKSNHQNHQFAELCIATPFGKMFFRTNENFEISTVSNPERSLVLIHGMIVSGSYMMPVAKHLAHDYRIYVPDFPGYGRSEKQEAILGIPELADALGAFMDGCGLHKATLVANSFGCQVAAEFAMRHPRKVDRMILQGPTVDPTARSVFRQALRLKMNSWREKKSVGMISMQEYRKAGSKRILKTISITLQDRLEEKLPGIETPVLIVRGDLDPVVPQWWAEEVARILRHSRIAVIPGAAHTLNYAEPDKFAEVIRSFLDAPNSTAGG